MNIAIRVDASTRMGLGHLVRCRTLGQGLRAQGAQVRFICRAHPGHQLDALGADTFAVTGLPAPPTDIDPVASTAADDYARWLGVPPPQDAAETLAALSGWRPDWLVVDHYGLDADWEQALRPQVGRILVIDDLANRAHDADLLLDQNHATDGEQRYAGLVPASARTLIGPRYTLLHPAYAEQRRNLRSPSRPVRRVLVFFGGTDPQNLTGLVLQALAAPELADLAVDCVVGATNPHRAQLARQAAARSCIRLYDPRPHLADLMAAADLAIGAGGTTTWERCCLGLPSLVVSIADNQRPACAALAAGTFIHYLGHRDSVSIETVRQAARQLIQDSARRQQFAAAGMALVDGLGTARVLRAMQTNTTGGGT